MIEAETDTGTPTFDLDTSAVEALAEVTEERLVIEARLEAMGDLEGTVSPEVFERVQEDYAGRLAGLEEKAQPLREQVWVAYSELRRRLAEVEQEVREIELEAEEAAFRHQLGELTDEQHEPQRQECAERLEARKGEIGDLEGIEARFVEAFGSREALEAMPRSERPEAGEVEPAGAGAPVAGPSESEEEVEPDEEEPTPGETETPLPARVDSTSEETVLGPLTVVPEPEPDDEAWRNEPTDLYDKPGHEDAGPADPPSLPPLPEGVAATVVVEPEVAGSLAEETEEEETEEEEEEFDTSTVATRIIAKPRLVLLSDEGQPKEFVLGIEATTIGRSPDNEIQLIQEAISRYHAQVAPSADGYLVRDLGSENGTFANGVRVDEHILSHGDIVQVGTKKLLYKEV